MAAPHRAAIALHLVLAAVLLVSCMPRTWLPSDYLNPDGTPVNLIRNLTLADDWAMGPTLQATGALAQVYLTFEPASDVAPLEPPVAGAEIYRLEYKSLLPYGDFEDPGDPPAQGWADNGGIAAIVDTPPFAIDGRTLHYTSATGADRLDFDLLAPAYGAADGFPGGAAYLARFSFRSGVQAVRLEFGDGSTELMNPWVFYSEDTNGNGAADMSDICAFPVSNVVPTYDVLSRADGVSTHYLSLGPGIQEVYVDNFRLVRADLSPNVQTALNHDLTLESPGEPGGYYILPSGRYRFSVWVHDDPTVGAARNRYASNAVVLEIAGGYSTSQVPIARTEAWATGWVLLSVESDHLELDTDPGTGLPVLTLRVSPTDWLSSAGLETDAGSLLISSPSLEFLSALE